MITEATRSDASDILSIQKAAYVSEAELYNDYDIQPLKQTIKDVEKDFDNNLILKYTVDGKILGSVRAHKKGSTCYVEKLMVDPYFQNRGIAKELMKEIESRFSNCRFELFTGSKSIKNISFYEKLGYKGFKTEKLPREETFFIFMEKHKE